MRTRAIVLLLAACQSHAQDPAEPTGLLERIQERMRENLARLPDYTCRQSIQRQRRAKPDQPWTKYDTLRVEVGFVAGQEVHGWSGSKLGEKDLRELAGKGSVGTGSFAMHARNVFLGKGNGFGYAGETALLDGRKAIRYDFEVPREVSLYKVRVAPMEAVVAFRGAFWVNPETLDLIKLMIEVDEVPGIPVASVSEVMEYARTPIGDSDFLLPKASELLIVTHEGAENRNLTQVEACRQYSSDSRINFSGDATEPQPAAPPAADPASTRLPDRALLELSLESEIVPETAAAGDAVRAVLAKALKQGDRVVVPEGAVVEGRLTRLEREPKPIPHYVIAMELNSIEWTGGRAAIHATMEDASGQGVMRVQKAFMPTFDRNRRVPAMSILVREQHSGQGVIHWDAKQPRIRKGLRMKWQLP